MVTVHEILGLKNFYNFRLIAGANGLDRVVEKGGFIDHETAEEMKGIAFVNEMIFSNLPMIKDEPEKIVDMVSALIGAQTACFAIKSRFFKEIPEEAIKLANENNYPLFLFDETYIEYLILDIDEIVNENKFLTKKLSIINDIQSGLMPPFKIRSSAYELNRYFKDYVVGCMIKSKKEGGLKFDAKTAVTVLGNSALVLPINEAYLILVTRNHPVSMMDLIQMLNIEEDYYIGISDDFDDLSYLDQVINQATSALKYACLKHKSLVYYNDIGVYQMLFSVIDNPSVSYYYKNIIDKLSKYDSIHQSDLLETAIMYVNSDGDIKLTADRLFQHQNTIRYRIRKIKSLIDFTELTGMQYETLALAVHIFELNTNRDKFSLL